MIRFALAQFEHAEPGWEVRSGYGRIPPRHPHDGRV